LPDRNQPLVLDSGELEKVFRSHHLPDNLGLFSSSL
jgi:hypothetical protein